MNNAKHLKNVLNYNIEKLAACKSDFLYEPDKDFTRDGKLSFESIVHFIIGMETGALKDEMFKHFGYSLKTATTSAMVQARSKIKYNAFEWLFHTFNDSSFKAKLFKGYRLIAIDGSTIPISYDEFDSETYRANHGTEIKGYNAFHMTAAYDLFEHTYDDVIIQGEGVCNENSAFNDLVDRYKNKYKAIFIGDRGFESLNSFVHVMKSGNKFLIRVKDIHSATSVAKSFGLPEGEFDMDVSRILTRRNTNEIKAHLEIYKFMPKNQRFDFFEEDNKFFDFKCRVVRFKISEDTYETIFTNLDREDFPSEIIKELYNFRWGVETSFRELKYAIGLNAFHAKKRNSIKQEIYARLILYNFSERVIRKIKIKNLNKKYLYQVNFTRAFHILREFLNKKGRKNLPDVESLIAKEILPIRPGRTDPRKVKPKSAVCFIYRFD